MKKRLGKQIPNLFIIFLNLFVKAAAIKILSTSPGKKAGRK